MDTKMVYVCPFVPNMIDLLFRARHLMQEKKEEI